MYVLKQFGIFAPVVARLMDLFLRLDWNLNHSIQCFLSLAVN